MVIVEVLPPNVTAPDVVLNTPEFPEKSIAPLPDANIALVAAENVAVPVTSTAPLPIVTVPDVVLNTPELPEKSIAPVPDASSAFVAPEKVAVAASDVAPPK
jgi:hypothetical protein